MKISLYKARFLIAVAISVSLSTGQAKGVKVKKVESSKEKAQKTESDRQKTLDSLPTYQGKVEFTLANPANSRRPNQYGVKDGDTVVMDGEKVDPNAPLNKEKFSEAEIEDITSENFPQVIESFDYPNADILEVVKAISELTGKNFIVDPGVRGKVTIIAPTKITVAEAYKAFLSALAINGFTLVKMGPFLKIRSARNAQRDNIETYSGDYYPNSDQMITRIIHLKHISAEEVNKNLRIIPSKDGEMAPYPPTNSIILSDYGANVDRVMKIIKQLDVPGFEEKMEVIPIKHAAAKDIAELIEQIINKDTSKGKSSSRRGSFSSGIPRFGSQKSGSKSEVISITVADDRTNAIIVVGNSAGIERIRNLVAQLDYKLSAEEAGGVRVYYVKHGEAEKIAETLSGITKEASKPAQNSSSRTNSSNRNGAPTPQQEPIFGGDVKIVADKATNSLIITASKNDYETVRAILRKIDIPRDQIFVKSVIMEMRASDANNYSASYFAFNSDTNGIGRVGFNGGGVGGLLDIPGTQGAVLSFGGGDTFEATIGGQTVTISSLTGFINFLTTYENANILSTPQLTALSNEEAEIEVGEDVPISVEQSQNGTSSTANVKREKVSIKLVITPFISPDSDLVRMKIHQTAKDISNTTVEAPELAAVAIALVDRSIKTNLVVKSGDTAVLGGLMSTAETYTERKIPLLGDIPIIGWLFKSRSKRQEKANLTVFITPKILRNPTDAQEVLKEAAEKRIGFVQEAFQGKDAFGKEMDEMAGHLFDDEIVEETLSE